MAPLPLAGYRVLELAHLIAGPVCGMYLADMGADVVKVEHPVEARDVLCVPVNGYADLPTDPAVRASGMLTEEDHPRAGRIRTLAPPIRFSETPGSIRTPSPMLGEHTDAVLAEAGVTAAELAHLKGQKVIA